MSQSPTLPPFDKYQYYLNSVQSPETDAEFLLDTFCELRDRDPKSMREDFCGTFSLCCEWVKLDESHVAVGVDLDEEPLEYGRKHFFEKLSDDEKERTQFVRGDVMKYDSKTFDIINALNFSYFIFKTRTELKAYFTKVYESLTPDGIFVIDVFGGSEVSDIHEEEVEFEEENFSYYWDQDTYNPVTNYAQFYIHYQRPGEPKRERVFAYDWRVWSIPELRDIMEEVGFKTSRVYWEGTDDEGEGDGEYYLTEEGEANCESWVAYIAACK